MYIKKIYEMGDYREIHKYFRYGCPKGKRGQKHDKTSDPVIRYNRKLKARKLQRLILANFAEGDWHLVLTYAKDERPETMAAAKKDLRAFIRKLKRRYEKAGHDIRYICMTERGKKGACHHHLIIQDVQDGSMSVKSAVMESWKGMKNFTPLYDQDAFRELADYMTKDETKEDQTGVSYSRSRNLITPKPKVRRIRAREWAEEPKSDQEFEVIKGTVETGENPQTGMPYLRYFMKRIKRRSKNDGNKRKAQKKKQKIQP